MKEMILEMLLRGSLRKVCVGISFHSLVTHRSTDLVPLVEVSDGLHMLPRNSLAATDLTGTDYWVALL